MNSIETLATFFLWCTVINILLILLLVLLSSLFHDGIGALTAMIFGVTKEEAKATFLRVFMQYRAAVVVLNAVPYIALEIMS